MMQDLLIKTGIRSYVTSIISPVPTAAQIQIPIAKTIPSQVGLIYGMAIYTDTDDPQGNNLITFANAQELYMVLKDGPTEFLFNIRLDAMIFNLAGFPNLNPQGFLNVAIPGNFDMSTSYYQNPTGIVSGEATTTIMLQLWYISTESYIWLMEKNYIDASFLQQFKASKR